MALTYTYSTGQITRDFRLKKMENDCRRDPERTVNIGIMCRTCPFYDGRYTHTDPEFKRVELVRCKFHKEDDPGLSEIIRKMYEKFEKETMTHFYD